MFVAMAFCLFDLRYVQGIHVIWEDLTRGKYEQSSQSLFYQNKRPYSKSGCHCPTIHVNALKGEVIMDILLFFFP